MFGLGSPPVAPRVVVIKFGANSQAAGQAVERFAAFGRVAGMFAIGSNRVGLFCLLLVALVFCAGIELLQVPLPTRHARLSDFTPRFARIIRRNRPRHVSLQISSVVVDRGSGARYP